MLPTDDKARKALPIFDGCIAYFPDALLAVAEVSKIGNDQHNPGQPLHWARGKSMDQFNTAMRHMMDHRIGGLRRDSDNGRHLAKAAWRILAALQLDIEAERDEVAKAADAFRAQGNGCSGPMQDVWRSRAVPTFSFGEWRNYGAGIDALVRG